MKANVINGATRLLRYTLLAGGLLYVVACVAVALVRMRYPFELEWMEGASLIQISRILAGQKLYVAPSTTFVPLIYTPLYFYLSALAARIVGLSFVPLRLVSLLASLGCLGLILLIVKEETRETFPGLLAACLFAATFRLGGAWFDIARVDMLFLFFLLAALYTLQSHTSVGAHVLAGALIFLAFFTKQTALAFALPLIAYAVLAQPRRSIWLVGSMAILVGLSTLLLDRLHGGWYSYYIFGLPGQHQIVGSAILGFWQRDLLWPLGIACALALLPLSTWLTLPFGRKSFLYLLAAVGMFGGSWAARVNYGGYNNAAIPAYAMIAILFGLGIHQLLEAVKRVPDKRASIWAIYILLLCLIQFAALVYNPRSLLPSQRDRQAGWNLVQTLRQTPGEVLIPYHGYLAVMAGKQPTAHTMAIGELVGGFGGGGTEAGSQLAEQFRQAISQRRYSLIILPPDGYWGLCQEAIERYYVRQGPVFVHEDVFWPVTGWRVRPGWIYVPRE